MTNEIICAAVFIMWFVTGRDINLCFVIFWYYLLYSSVGAFPHVKFNADEVTIFATYYSQTCFDVLALVSTLTLSLKYQSLVRIYLLYSCVIASSAVLNAAMLVDQAFEFGVLRDIHYFRQEISAPIDVVFAVLGSSKGGQVTNYINRSLLAAYRSVYNRLNRISNHNEGARS